MFRTSKLQRLVLAVTAAGLLMTVPAEAGLLSRIARKAGDAAGSAGRHLDGPAKLLDEGVSLAKKLPRTADGAGAALLPAGGGRWRLVTPDGKSLPVHSLDDLPQGIDDAARAAHRPLAGDSVSALPKSAKNVSIAIREADFFKLRDQLNGLPAHAKPVLVRPNGKSYPLKSIAHGAGSRLAVELGPDVLINPASGRALDGNIKFLSRPVNKANLRLARFDSTAQTAASQASSEMIVDLNADILESSLSKFKNRTLAVSGQIVRDANTGLTQLAVRDGKKLRHIDLQTFQNAAERQRVNLMIVESASPAQPGKSWFSRTALEKRFANAQASMTQADLMAAVSPPNTSAVIHAADERNYRLVTTTSHAPKPAQQAPASTGADDYSATGWLLDAGIRAGTRSVLNNHEDPDHTDEVESRWIPWISNFSLILGAAMAAFTLFLSWYLWKWWNGLWGYLFGNSRGAGRGSLVLRVIKVLAFLPFAFVMAVPALLWMFVGDWLKFLTWPLRKAFGK